MNPTSATEVILEWTVPYDAGSEILDYSLEVELDSTWTVIKSDITALTYTYAPTILG